MTGAPERPYHAAVMNVLPRARPSGVGQVHPGELVKVQGVTRPGPDGLLRAPVSGQPCVWFRVLEVAMPPDVVPQRLGMRPGLDSDGDVPGATPFRDERSDRPFVIEDATGSLTVHSELVDTVFQPVDGRDGDLAHGVRISCEWIVPPDVRLFACGVVDPSGVLGDGPGAPLLASTRTEDAYFYRSVTTVTAASSIQQRRAYDVVRLRIAAVAGVFALILLIAYVVLR